MTAVSAVVGWGASGAVVIGRHDGRVVIQIRAQPPATSASAVMSPAEALAVARALESKARAILPKGRRSLHVVAGGRSRRKRARRGSES